MRGQAGAQLRPVGFRDEQHECRVAGLELLTQGAQPLVPDTRVERPVPAAGNHADNGGADRAPDREPEQEAHRTAGDEPFTDR